MDDTRRLLIGRTNPNDIRTFQYSVLTTDKHRMFSIKFKCSWNRFSDELDRLDDALPDDWKVDVLSDLHGKWCSYNRKGQ